MTRKFSKTILVISVHSEGDNPVFADSATHVCIEDEAGGPFIILKQVNDQIQPGEVRLDYEELKTINEAVEMMFTQEGIKNVD